MPITSVGTVLKKGTTAIAGLTSIGGVEVSSDTIEITTLDVADGYRQYAGSFKDGGEISLEGFFEKTHSTLMTDFEAQTSNAYTITFADGSAWGFSGVVISFATGVDLGDMVSMSCTIKVSGKPTLTVAP